MSSTVSKTKQKILDVSRKLFARKGVDNTTMNEIAESSGFGRRTIYMHFKNKNDIYHAAISSEIESMHTALQKVVKLDMPPEEKLMMFTFARLDVIRDVVRRNGTLRADFFRNIWLVENVRKEFDKKEVEYLEQILAKGVEKGVFEVNDVCKTAEILHYALKGLEVPSIRGVINLNYHKKEDREIISNLIFKGLSKKEI